MESKDDAGIETQLSGDYSKNRLDSKGRDRNAMTRDSRIAAVVTDIEDLAALEAFEMDQDVRAYLEVKAKDNGQRISLKELRQELSA